MKNLFQSSQKLSRLLLCILIAIIMIAIMSSCADASHVDNCLPVTEHTYGFWGGTWHGMILWFSFIGSLIWDDVAIYAVNNNGAWYDFGFVGGFFLILRLTGFVVKGLKE